MFGMRLGCVASQLVWAVRAPFDGALAGLRFGLQIAPKLGTLFNLLTTYLVPVFFGGAFAAIGLALGLVALLGGGVEAVAQFVVPQPYKKPVCRILVDFLTFT